MRWQIVDEKTRKACPHRFGLYQSLELLPLKDRELSFEIGDFYKLTVGNTVSSPPSGRIQYGDWLQIPVINRWY